MDDEDDSTPTLEISSREMRELIGMFDAPAFARRGQDLEHLLAATDARLRRSRHELLEMVRLRLKQWAAVARPGDWADAFAAPVDDLYAMADAPPPEWAASPAPAARRRAVARDLVASVARFNARWSKFVGELNYESVNRQIDGYNRYYVLEKECAMGSSRLAARHFTPRPHLTPEAVLARHPPLPQPAPRAR